MPEPKTKVIFSWDTFETIIRRQAKLLLGSDRLYAAITAPGTIVISNYIFLRNKYVNNSTIPPALDPIIEYFEFSEADLRSCIQLTVVRDTPPSRPSGRPRKSQKRNP